ncbi:type III secretion system inner membrane ring lipoprotein SctJ [Sphingosinicella sp. BN140058]|uniref:type III secretion system inner membrane ring lipoprotein SctJ n=1 Tax=Sphingosinicella sp. BN140058 TaxID=1892855 RepID=UPI0010106163|nr:type III secretion inner membrane ring lipoprotein SctJ [Sphingosinicella sp. BN140058]QAY75569.1 EscJ/YscJ/HrcJ family type III secretion inner membrane ring protein [Sphingosinicella sp. BN140058]
MTAAASFRRRPGRAALPLLLLAAVTLSGCGRQEVYGKLTENAANEMVAVLSQAGIEAGKAKGEKEEWSVTVSQGDFAKAVETLRAQGLPHENFDDLGTVFKKEGFTSTPLEERARLIYGLSQELSRTISDIDGVVQARVHLTMPEADPLSREAKPSAASVFVKYRTGFDLRSQTGAIKALVTNAIDGLTYDRVSVVMVPAQALPMLPQNDDSVSISTLVRGLVVVVAASVLAFAGLALLRMRRRRPGLPDVVRP